MPRRMSFALTEPQLRDGSKTVTRRLGWRFLKVGDQLLAVDKAMGLKKGEKPRVLARVEVVSVRREPLSAITAEDVAAEGFPGKTPEWFVAFFCQKMRCTAETELTRIEFKLLTDPQTAEVLP